MARSMTGLAVTLALAILVAPPAGAEPAGAGLRACATGPSGTAPAGTGRVSPGSGGMRAWTPQSPLHQGLHLLPGTPRHDDGALRPRHVFDDHWLTLPARVDLSAWAPPVGDQGYVGSCAAWAATYTLVGWYINHEHLAVGDMTPAYTYHQISWGRDQGSVIGAALDADTRGMVPMSLYPQGNYDWHSPPSGYQLAVARHWRVVHPQVVYQPWSHEPPHTTGSAPPLTREERMNHARYLIEQALARGQPGLVEVQVDDNLYTATTRTAWIGPTAAHAILHGWHALVALGYDSAGLWVENSWGTG